ncbi:MAG TPA: GNAT family N-acetyltransferase [Bryobacteraceae bacterium]
MSEIARIVTPERSRVRRALGVLGVRYPNGLDWLERRLDDIECGRAQLWQVGHGRVAFGWAIVTPKGRHEAKLSTIYIAPAARGRGWGRKLMDALSTELLHRDILNVRVTVDENDAATRSFFEIAGFTPLPDSRRRYGARFDSAYLLDLDARKSLPVSAN